MKSQALKIVMETPSQTLGFLRLREYLQHVILRNLAEQKCLSRWVFHGGTALRILHGLNRFSEDLDFHLNSAGTDSRFSESIEKLRTDLGLQGYVISDSPINEKTVNSAFIKFEALLAESGLSQNPTQKLAIKVELDSNPPAGWQIQRRLVNVHFPFSVRFHDVPSFLSGKLHAILQRPYIKGRDFYDLSFILSRWPDVNPNFSYLGNALEQTNYPGRPLDQASWKSVIRDHIQGLHWEQVVSDVAPFLSSTADLVLVDRELLLELLQ